MIKKTSAMLLPLVSAVSLNSQELTKDFFIDSVFTPTIDIIADSSAAFLTVHDFNKANQVLKNSKDKFETLKNIDVEARINAEKELTHEGWKPTDYQAFLEKLVEKTKLGVIVSSEKTINDISQYSANLTLENAKSIFDLLDAKEEILDNISTYDLEHIFGQDEYTEIKNDLLDLQSRASNTARLTSAFNSSVSDLKYLWENETGKSELKKVRKTLNALTKNFKREKKETKQPIFPIEQQALNRIIDLKDNFNAKILTPFKNGKDFPEDLFINVTPYHAPENLIEKEELKPKEIPYELTKTGIQDSIWNVDTFLKKKEAYWTQRNALEEKEEKDSRARFVRDSTKAVTETTILTEALFIDDRKLVQQDRIDSSQKAAKLQELIEKEQAEIVQLEESNRQLDEQDSTYKGLLKISNETFRKADSISGQNQAMIDTLSRRFEKIDALTEGLVYDWLGTSQSFNRTFFNSMFPKDTSKTNIDSWVDFNDEYPQSKDTLTQEPDPSDSTLTQIKDSSKTYTSSENSLPTKTESFPSLDSATANMKTDSLIETMLAGTPFRSPDSDLTEIEDDSILTKTEELYPANINAQINEMQKSDLEATLNSKRKTPDTAQIDTALEIAQLQDTIPIQDSSAQVANTAIAAAIKNRKTEFTFSKEYIDSLTNLKDTVKIELPKPKTKFTRESEYFVKVENDNDTSWGEENDNNWNDEEWADSTTKTGDSVIVYHDVATDTIIKQKIDSLPASTIQEVLLDTLLPETDTIIKEPKLVKPSIDFAKKAEEYGYCSKCANDDNSCFFYCKEDPANLTATIPKPKDTLLTKPELTSFDSLPMDTTEETSIDTLIPELKEEIAQTDSIPAENKEPTKITESNYTIPRDTLTQTLIDTPITTSDTILAKIEENKNDTINIPDSTITQPKKPKQDTLDLVIKKEKPKPRTTQENINVLISAIKKNGNIVNEKSSYHKTHTVKLESYSVQLDLFVKDDVIQEFRVKKIEDNKKTMFFDNGANGVDKVYISQGSESVRADNKKSLYLKTLAKVTDSWRKKKALGRAIDLVKSEGKTTTYDGTKSWVLDQLIDGMYVQLNFEEQIKNSNKKVNFKITMNKAYDSSSSEETPVIKYEDKGADAVLDNGTATKGNQTWNINESLYPRVLKSLAHKINK